MQASESLDFLHIFGAGNLNDGTCERLAAQA